MGPKLTLVAAAIAALVSAVAAGVTTGGGKAQVDETRPVVTRRASGESYASLVEGLDVRIASLENRASARSGDWLTRMHLATALLDRASLTHDVADYARVEAVLDEAFAIAPDGSGPLLVAARFNLAVHRFEAAETFLDRIDARAVPRRDEQVVADILRAQIALGRGQYATAGESLRASAEIAPMLANADLALYHLDVGALDEATALFERALASTSAKDPRRRAWLRLQLGRVAMTRGDLPAAISAFHGADDELPGWWLVHEHLAVAHNRAGEHRKATLIYEELVRTTGLPQHMDALARCLRHAGRDDEAARLIERASAAWTAQLARFPESAMGHGVEHELEFGQPARALVLATANYAARPGGDAAVLLAEAHLNASDPTRALEVARRAAATAYRSAALHDVIARAHLALGDTAAADRELALRAAIDPTYTGRVHLH